MTAEFIDIGDQRWRKFLGSCSHDFYHLAEYAAFAARHVGGEATAFIGEANGTTLFVPLILFSLPDKAQLSGNSRDARSPYGYAAPILSGDNQNEALLWQLFADTCCKNGLLSVFMRSHPLLETPLNAPSCATVVHEGETVFIDLSKSEEELWFQTRENHRKDIRKLLKAGYHTVIDDWHYLNAFVDLYRETMLRVGANEYYLFSSDYFHDLKALNSGRIHLCTVLSKDHDVAASGLFFSHHGLVQFHLSGTAEKHMKRAPSKLMFDFVRRWAKERGDNYLHLGGGVGCRQDSLFNFKAGFSHDRADFHTLRMICDQTRYKEVVTEITGEKNLPLSSYGHFPSYRINDNLVGIQSEASNM